MPVNRRSAQGLAVVASVLAGAAALLLVACSAPAPPQAPGPRVAGARDVLPLVEGLQTEFSQTTGLVLHPITSTSSLADLKAGQVDAALVGRELTPAELQGLDDHIVAYDAVCLLINSRTYAGGVQQSGISGGQLLAKYGGISQLTLDDVKGYLATVLRLNSQQWQLHGPVAGSFVFQVYQDANGQPQADPAHPDQYLGTWVWTDVSLSGEMTPAGKFDTQAALLQTFGFPESALNQPAVSFAPSILDSEEELISFRFRIDEQAEAPISTRPFDWYVAVASRRITVRAIQHGFALRALSIDGVDPLSSASVIYSGAYPLSRKIHLLTRQPADPGVQPLLKFLLSPTGQLLVQRASYLPLPPGQAGN